MGGQTQPTPVVRRARKCVQITLPRDVHRRGVAEAKRRARAAHAKAQEAGFTTDPHEASFSRFVEWLVRREVDR